MSDPINLDHMRMIVEEQIERGLLNARFTTKRDKHTGKQREALELSNGKIIPFVRLRYNSELGFFDRKEHVSALCELHGTA